MSEDSLRPDTLAVRGGLTRSGFDETIVRGSGGCRGVLAGEQDQRRAPDVGRALQAHAAADPWKGHNALDAMILLFSSVGRNPSAVRMPSTPNAPR